MAVQAHVLVVANVNATSEDLLAALQAPARRSPSRLPLPVPGQGPGLSGRRAGAPQMQAALERWRAAGLEADGLTGDSDPIDAVRETWDPKSMDEVIVSTLPGQSSKWLR